MIIKQRIAVLLVLVGALALSASTASASIAVGSAGICVSEAGDILVYAKGIALCKVFLGDSNHEQISGTDLLSYDPNRSISKSLSLFGAPTRDEKVYTPPGTPEYFSQVNPIGNYLGTATAVYGYDEDNIPVQVIGWQPDTKWVDMHVNVDLQGMFNSGVRLWLMYQRIDESPQFTTLPLTLFTEDDSPIYPYLETPEPATLTLLAIGGLAMLRRRAAR